MATVSNKRKLAAFNKEECEERPSSNLEQNTNVSRSQEVYITQISEKTEGRVTKKLLKVFSGTESRILGALSWLDEFLLNPLIQGHYGSTVETSWNALGTNPETNEGDSQKDLHPKASVSQSHTTRNSGPDDGHDSPGGRPVWCLL